MKKIISLFLLVSVCSLCFPQLFGNNKKDVILIKDPYTLDDLEKLKTDFFSDKSGALENLISIYQDQEQTLSVRMAALDILAESENQNPILKVALQKTISDMEFIEIDIMKKAIKILLTFDSLESTDFLLEGLSKSVLQMIEFRSEMIEAIGENNTEDKIITLLDLYEISLKDHQRMNELLTLSLGELDDDRAIPILMDIAKNNDIDLHIRNRAIEILSRKNAPELVDFFVEMLGSPGSNDQMLNFIHNSMGIVERDRLMMALLESYQTGKTRYHAVLHSIMTSLEDYQNPEIKPVFIEVAKTDGFPRLLRIKAIQALEGFNDVSVLDELIPMLENSYNYDYYYELNNLATKLKADETYKQKIKLAGYKAMQNNLNE